MRALSIYSSYFLQFLKSRLEYKGDFLASVFANLVVSASGLLFVVFLMDGEVVNNLQGWSREEVLFIYGYSLISMAFFSMVAPNLYRFGDRYIIQGEFDRVLLRPLNSVCQVLFESFNLESIGGLLVGLGLIFYTSAELQMQIGILDVLWIVVSGLSGGIILISVFVTLASLSFHFEDRLGIGAPVYNLIRFGRYPLPIFNNVIQFILKWIVPFAFAAFYPATHFFEREEFWIYCYSTPLMALLCLGFASLAWNFGVSRYSSTGN
jgi:ABC-2 type transport system permease protein